MFSGEAELQARRRTLAVLQDEMRRVFDSARDLSIAFESLVGDDSEGLQAAIERIRKAQDDVEALRRTLTRELAEIGTMMMNREDLLRTAYDVEEVAGFIAGTAFRFKQVSSGALRKQGLDRDIRELVDMSIESIRHLNNVARALAINPMSAIDMAGEVQKLERDIDYKYRSIMIKLFKDIESIKDLIVLKDIIEGIEDMADRCLAASDSMTIVAIGL